MKKICALGLLLICGLFAGCNRYVEPQAERRAVPSNTDYVVEALFVVDGATVYRFHDKGEWRYFVLPVGSTLGQHKTTDDDKTIVHPHSIPTVKPVPVERGR